MRLSDPWLPMSEAPNTPALAVYLQGLAESARMSKCTRESHEAAKLDDVAWSSMEYVGIQETDQDYYLELRNCKCGSTLARRIAKPT